MKLIKNYKNIDDTICFDLWNGPVVSIFGWVHGNEHSGVKAIEKFTKQLENWEIKLKKWKIIFVKKANQKALEINKREVEKNMNRLFLKWIKWDDYETQRAQQLMKILDEANYHLDLHSTSWKSVPFLFAEKNTLEFIKTLWIYPVVFGWWELGNDVLSWDSENYVNHNNWIGLTFEAWNHDDETAEKNAYQAILNFLVNLDIIDKKYFKMIWDEKKIVKLENVYVAKNDNFQYTIEVKNFQKIKKWTLFAKDGNIDVIAEKDFIITMPKSPSVIKKWIEAFLFGKELDF